MPTLRIISIYRERKRMFATELAQARTELEQFRASIVTHFGTQTADAIRRQAWWTEDMILGKVDVPQLPEEGAVAAKKLQMLDRKVRAVWKKIRTPDCWFREQPTPISVLETVGLTWSMVKERCSADGRLPLEQILWLLNALSTTEQVMPTEEQVWAWAASGYEPCHLPEEWRRVLRRRRRRLVRLLHTAVMLEENVRCGCGS